MSFPHMYYLHFRTTDYFLLGTDIQMGKLSKVTVYFSSFGPHVPFTECQKPKVVTVNSKVDISVKIVSIKCSANRPFERAGDS